MNLCITPIPPFLAIPIAILYSVTVSIGDDTNGTNKGMFLENILLT